MYRIRSRQVYYNMFKRHACMPVETIYQKTMGTSPHQQSDAIAQWPLSHRHRADCSDTHARPTRQGVQQWVDDGMCGRMVAMPLPMTKPCRPFSDAWPTGPGVALVVPLCTTPSPGPSGHTWLRCKANAQTRRQSFPLMVQRWLCLYPPVCDRYQKHYRNHFIDQFQSGNVTPGNRSKMHL